MSKYLTVTSAVILVVGILAGAALHKRNVIPAAIVF